MSLSLKPEQQHREQWDHHLFSKADRADNKQFFPFVPTSHLPDTSTSPPPFRNGAAHNRRPGARSSLPLAPAPVSDQVNMTLVNKSCKGAITRCAARSTCGKPGFVTCCRTNSKGVTKCSTKSSGDSCKPPKGGSACASVHSSCCDACTASGCASPSGAFLDTGFLPAP